MLKLFIKGFIIGLGKIIPGISGSLIAIYLKVYEEAISKISNLTKNFKDNFIYLFFLGLGILTSIIFFSNIIMYLLNKNYYMFMSIIIGLILGIVPDMFKDIKIIKFKEIVYFLIPFIPLIFLNMNFRIKGNYVVLGLIESLTTIIPGISGTAIYMMFGCYNIVLNIFKNPFTTNGLIFGISFIISFILLAKLINYLLNKYNRPLKIVIFSFTLSSIISILKPVKLNYFNIFFLSIGFYLSKKINSYLN